MSKNKSPDDPRWCASSADDIVWAGWDDEWVAYHRPSGTTHFLNSASKYLLVNLLQEPRNQGEIVESFGLTGDLDDQRDEMISLLEHLEDLGLVEQR